MKRDGHKWKPNNTLPNYICMCGNKINKEFFKTNIPYPTILRSLMMVLPVPQAYSMARAQLVTLARARFVKGSTSLQGLQLFLIAYLCACTYYGSRSHFSCIQLCPPAFAFIADAQQTHFYHEGGGTKRVYSAAWHSFKYGSSQL